MFLNSLIGFLCGHVRARARKLMFRGKNEKGRPESPLLSETEVLSEVLFLYLTRPLQPQRL